MNKEDCDNEPCDSYMVNVLLKPEASCHVTAQNQKLQTKHDHLQRYDMETSTTHRLLNINSRFSCLPSDIRQFEVSAHWWLPVVRSDHSKAAILD